MIRRNLIRRLEELEARLAPAAEPMIFQITYVSPDGSEEDGPRFTIPSGGRPAELCGIRGVRDNRGAGVEWAASR
jgi:hypothetical protein